MRAGIVVERERLVVRTRADGRNVYSKSGKAALVAACRQPGASVAAVAMAHGVNANLLRKWLVRQSAGAAMQPQRGSRQREESLPNDAATAAQFLPVALAPAPVTKQEEIEASAAIPKATGMIQIHLGDARIEIKGIVESEALQRVLDCLRREDHAATAP